MSGQGPEYTLAEAPTLRQLEGMATLSDNLGWEHIEAKPLAPTPEETDSQGTLLRDDYHHILLFGILRRQLQAINLDSNGQPWLDTPRINQAVNRLKDLDLGRLMEKNETATNLLLSGTQVEGLQGKDVSINYIDFDHPERNSFLAINQFRIDPPGITGPKGSHRPDIILFVNGIPLVVIECKTYGPDMLTSGIQDLLKYSNQRGSDTPEGVESLFYYNQLMVACTPGRAIVGTVGSKPKHFLEWKDTQPFPPESIAQNLGIQQPNVPPEELVDDTTEDDMLDQSGLNRRQQLIAGLLYPSNLLDIVRHYTLYTVKHSRRIKIVPRYQQFRAVYKAIHRLIHGQPDADPNLANPRGGIIWHYQGSGKSLDMVFILRKLRTIPELQAFKVVIITDRTDLEDQLSGTAALSGQPLQVTKSTKDLAKKLRQTGPGLIFGMIQKFRKISTTRDLNPKKDTADNYDNIQELNETLNESDKILLLIDEAHRSHGNILHAYLNTALPNCIKIGFTGTPIISGKKKKTAEIFGSFIDEYTIRDSQRDGVTVPILYEGLEAMGAVTNADLIDQLFDVLFTTTTYSEEDRARIRAKVTKTDIRQAKEIMQAKAKHLLRHYLTRIMSAGFKAQLATSSRQACVDYHKYLSDARDELVQELESQAVILEQLTPDTAPDNLRYLAEAYQYLPDIKRLEFAAIISGSQKKDPSDWKQWTEETNHTQYINRFWKPLTEDGMAILIVQSKLLVGFDAPLEQVLYVDRNLEEDGLLQAIARTNRTAEGKSYGLIVDYYGIDIAKALAVYDQEDVSQAFFDITEEKPKLDEAHRRVIAFWQEHNIDIYGDLEICSNLLQDMRLRAEFFEHLRRFLKQLDIFFPRSEAIQYYGDAKRLGEIKKLVDDIYRDEVPEDTKVKIQSLIDQYVTSQGIDQKIEPLDILTLDLSQQAPRRRRTAQANAAEMENALRREIRNNLNDDPIYFQNLSQKITEIIERLGEDWDAREEEIRNVARGYQTDQSDDAPGTDRRIRPFYNALAEKVANPDPPEPLETYATELVDFIASETTKVTNFWTDPVAREELRKQIWQNLEDSALFPDDSIDKLADDITHLAKQHSL